MPTRKSLLTALALLLCAVVLWWAYASFQARYLRTFDDQTTLFEGSQLQLPAGLAGPGPIRVVHFWDPACPCNVGNQQHLGELIEHFAPKACAFMWCKSPVAKVSCPAIWQRSSP